MAGSHVRRGDTVGVISGRERGKRGKVLRVLPEKSRVVIEKVNMIKKHQRPTQKVRQGGIIVGPAARRRAAAGSPVPPRRERPPDLEATAQGVQLYGPRRAVPAPYQLAGPTSSTPADTTGTKLAYRPLEDRPARVTGIRLHLPAASAGMVAAVQLLRGGATHELYRTAAGGELEVDTDLVLEPGDELRVEVLTAGADGTTLVSHISAEAGP